MSDHATKSQNAGTSTMNAHTHAATRRQRLANFCAHHSQCLFPMAESFVQRMDPVFPGVRRMVRVNGRAARFDFACVVSTLCKHADHLPAIAPMIESMGEQMAGMGFTAMHVGPAKEAFIAAVREHSRESWTAELENDLGEVCDEFFACMNVRSGAPMVMRMAA
jgi:hypothetical protein